MIIDIICRNIYHVPPACELKLFNGAKIISADSHLFCERTVCMLFVDKPERGNRLVVLGNSNGVRPASLRLSSVCIQHGTIVHCLPAVLS